MVEELAEKGSVVASESVKPSAVSPAPTWYSSTRTVTHDGLYTLMLLSNHSMIIWKAISSILSVDFKEMTKV